MAVADSGYYTPETLTLRRRLAEAMLGQGMSSDPIGSPWQGVARIAQAMLGGYQLNKLQEQERTQQESANQALLGLLGPVSSPESAADTGVVATPAIPAPMGGDLAAASTAIASIETPGEADPYRALGPVVKSGDRAYGKYQVMGDNVRPWTKEILGKEMTPDEFLADSDAQEKVFAGKFGQYLKKYGNAQDAASVWFTGRKASESADAQARDAEGNPIGIKGSEYVKKFTDVYGGGTTQPKPAASAAKGIDASTRLQIGRLLANPATRELGQAMIMKLVTKTPAAKPASVQEYEYAKAQGYPGTYQQFQTELKQAGRTQVNVGTGGFDKRLGEELGEDFAKRRTAAQDASQGLLANAEARNLLDSNIITGTGAEWRLNLGKALYQAGLKASDDQEANTEAFVSAMGRNVATIAKQFGSGAGITDADRKFAEKVAGGQIELNENSIRRILDINEKASRRVISSYNKDAEKINPDLVPYPLTVEMPPEYKSPKVKKREEEAGGGTDEEILNEARGAISRGKDRNKIIERLNSWGIDTGGL